MNSLEAEYSFLAPTWKLPTVATPSMYAATHSKPFVPPGNRSDADWTTWNNTMQNSGYIPSTVTRRANPNPPKERSAQANLPPPPPPPPPLVAAARRNPPQEYFHRSMDDLTPSADEQEYPFRSPPTQKRRVQIIDHRHSPSTDRQSGQESVHSYGSTQHKNKVTQNANENEQPGHSAHSNLSRSKVHEHHHSNAAPDSGSYVHAYENQQRRSHQKTNGKAVLNEYKHFVRNGGFGPAFGSNDYQTHEEKLDTERKRKSYSKLVRESNQYKLEEQKRFQYYGGAPPQRSMPRSLVSHRPWEPPRSHFLSAQEVREFEKRIKREHDANCKCSLHTKPYQSSA